MKFYCFPLKVCLLYYIFTKKATNHSILVKITIIYRFIYLHYLSFLDFKYRKSILLFLVITDSLSVSSNCFLATFAMFPPT